MSDDKKNRGEPDRSRISLSEDYEISYWTRELGISESELRGAVAAVGNSSARVREHLKR